MLQLDVHMSPWQYRDGFAERIGELLAAGTFIGCRGRWRVHRRLAEVATLQDGQITVNVRRVRFELEPLDDVARAEVDDGKAVGGAR